MVGVVRGGNGRAGTQVVCIDEGQGLKGSRVHEADTTYFRTPGIL
jgi:hypothetical protein